MRMPAVRGQEPPFDSGRLDPSQDSAQQAFAPYLRAVKRHWMLIAALTLLAGAAALVTVARSHPSYQATASILVTPLPEGDPNFLGIGVVLDTGDPARTVQTAAALVQSPGAAALTAQKLGRHWTATSVENAVSVTPLGQSDVLAVSATASSAAEAARVANTYATQAIAYRAQIVQRNIRNELSTLQARLNALAKSGASTSSQASDLAGRMGELRAAQTGGGDPSLSVSQAATVPSSPGGTPHWVVVLLALIGGFAVGSVAALGIDFFGRPLRDEDELAELVPAPVLATVPRLRHRGDSPLSPAEFPPAAFEQIRMLRVQLEMGGDSPVVAVTSAGAGDGKTTLVAALAAAFSESGRRAMVIDLDFRRPSLARTLGVELAPPVRVEHDGPPAGGLIDVPNLPHVQLLPLPVGSPETIDEVMTRLPVVLAQAQRVVDCVIIDTAPIGVVSETLRIASMAETVVFVARPGHTDRRRLLRARDLLARAGIRLAGLVLIGQSLPGSYGGYYGYVNQTGNGAHVPGAKQPAKLGIARRKARH
jgi:Mrp family chromosome partitioning ATPase/uncharacterized protein involved in exopolysaccharide biosynthesis